MEDWDGQGGPVIFLAGGISNCADWQSVAVGLIEDTFPILDPGRDIVLLNPRRASYTDAPGEAERQIRWEYRHLRKASAILFWFPSETLCPITLYELGAWAMTDKPLFVGADPAYARRLDVVEQLHLVRPEIRVQDTLHETLQVAAWWRREMTGA